MPVPYGYTAAFQIINKIWNYVYEDLEQYPWLRPDLIEKVIVSALVGGRISAVEWDIEQGQQYPISQDFWLKPAALEVFSISEPKLLLLPAKGKGRARKSLILIEDKAVDELMSEFIKSSNPDEVYFLEEQSEAVQKLLAEINSEDVGSTQQRNRVGRPTHYDWDKFWIEVAMYAAREDLTKDDWRKFAKHMREWCFENFSDGFDKTNINKKIKPLKQRVWSMWGEEKPTS